MKKMIFLLFCAQFAAAEFIDDFTRNLTNYGEEISNRVDSGEITNPVQPDQGESRLFTSKNSTEAIMTFEHEVLYTSGSTSKSVAKKMIESQLKHMFGPMSHSHALKAVPKEDHKITKISVSRAGDGLMKATYKYRGTIMVEKGSNGNKVLFPLPKNPQDIYEQGIVVDGGERSFPCTDPHYQSEGDFWYFWDPNKWGCELKDGVHYDTLSADIKRRNNTKKSFPEYNKLIRKSGDIEVMVLFGMDKPHKYSNDPHVSKDVNAYNYVAVKRYMLRNGFQQIEKFSREHLRNVYGVNKMAANTEKAIAEIATIERFEKITEKGPIRVTLYFGPSGISEENNVLFHAYLAWALQSSSAMIYNGHSGLGGHLNLSYIEDIFASKHLASGKIELSKEQYQIYYFNSCSSYPYYNSMYFGRKMTSQDRRGSKKLDIITNGLATYFSVIDDTSIELIRMIDQWGTGKHTASYQEFVRNADSDNLLGVNGDEDNPKKASEVQ